MEGVFSVSSSLKPIEWEEDEESSEFFFSMFLIGFISSKSTTCPPYICSWSKQTTPLVFGFQNQINCTNY